MGAQRMHGDMFQTPTELGKGMLPGKKASEV